MKIISDRNKLPIAQASDIDRAAPEGKGAKWAQTNLHQNPDLPRHPDPAEGAFSEKEAHQRAGIPPWQKRYLDPPVQLLLPQVLLNCHWSQTRHWDWYFPAFDLVISRKICSHRYLGACAGMWVISRGIYLGVLVLSFISVLLFQRSGHSL